jgi:hypothetical protein
VLDGKRFVLLLVRSKNGIDPSRLTKAVYPSGANSSSKARVQWLAVRKTFEVIMVPEQIGRISPFGAFTMNAPVFAKVLFESTNP